VGRVPTTPEAQVASGDSSRFKLEASINFTYVQEIDDRGESRFISRRIEWRNRGVSEVTGVTRIVCNDQDDVDLGSSRGVDQVAGTASKALKIDCETTDFVNYFGYFIANPVPGNVRRIRPPRIVSLADLTDGCSYSEEKGGYRYSVWVTTEFDAVVEVNNARGSPYALRARARHASVLRQVPPSVPSSSRSSATGFAIPLRLNARR
jgi:hypothetical protein